MDFLIAMDDIPLLANCLFTYLAGSHRLMCKNYANAIDYVYM